jgi:3-hydroxy acid dehydrogenase / malonic semialdehyde reductase
MKNYIKNKTALVTGASSGIGKKLSLDLIDYDVNLILVARDIKKLQRLKKQLQNKSTKKIDIYQMDVSKKNEVAKTMNKILTKDNIDILINNAGCALGLEKIYKGDINNWDMMIDTNIKGLLYVSRPVIIQMKDKKTAHIINLGSVAGKTAYPGGNVYCATKASVHAITDAMNADLIDTNIKVSTIAPGAVKTNFSMVRFASDKQKAQDVYEGFTPLRASDISSVIINTINTPPHVNIQYIDIMPTS